MKIHIAPPYFLSPTHPITVNLIGCGGTGTQVLSALGRIDHCLKALNKPGLYITVYDPDIVTPANIGRQLFCKADLGLNKAFVMVSRMNAFWGTAWDAIAEKFNEENARSCNITISCVDNLKSRKEIAKILKQQSKYNQTAYPYKTAYYWMDFGNGRETGQVILGTVQKIKHPKSKEWDIIDSLPTFIERYDVKKIDEKDSGPSCSVAEALNSQDLFINSSLAQDGCDLLWQFLKNGSTDKAGLYKNLALMNTNAIPL